MALNGWHRGEASIRSRTGLDKDPSLNYLYMSVGGELPHDHAIFHSTRLPFLPVAIQDEDGRPWASILAGSGALGFVSYPRYTTLVARAQVWDGDPIHNMKLRPDGTGLIAGLGVELSTRRRNKFAGKITSLTRSSSSWDVEMTVDEAIGNCPKYIPVRELEPHQTHPIIQFSNYNFTAVDTLPDIALDLIHRSDMLFFATALESTDPLYPAHLGMNIRGGRPGFTRIISDRRTLVMPDYSGNRILTSLGNIEATPLAGLVFPDFDTGDVLYLTGEARNLVGDEASQIMFQQDRLTTIHVTGAVYISNALPVRVREGTEVQPSPYSPPVKLLNEESASRVVFSGNDTVSATLVSMRLVSETIGTFTFATSKPLNIVPGQAIILDLSGFLGALKYRHMAPSNPVSVNDDRIRTWTVSGTNKARSEFALTLKLKPGGAATTAFFSIAHNVPPPLLDDARQLGLEVPVIGITGEFSLSDSGPSGTRKRALMVAGGIGVTPFLAMLKAAEGWDITILLASREPEVLVPLLLDAASSGRVKALEIHVFSSLVPRYHSSDSRVHAHQGRLNESWISGMGESWADRDVFLCGPRGMNEVAKEGLKRAGVDVEKVKEEGFAY
ncbi:hypothetical protein CYLTODRAFT_401684 [Cylindrobasidium torrendii FP15055 ss-10]|uniref:Oxidoreductase FAD/NAD(P)-binding domain-containing protein n=1 Tax=Cylindrobasidium torrendii FP15055 ss-10 TaxID=1314674 RepID=A0A0D7B1Q2_9AGAR|nr:hypothetical protein CYLTODRAFT_401684 [Cylindrobasidium torrendii FP15055 ss-10]